MTSTVNFDESIPELLSKQLPTFYIEAGIERCQNPQILLQMHSKCPYIFARLFCNINLNLAFSQSLLVVEFEFFFKIKKTEVWTDGIGRCINSHAE